MKDFVTVTENYTDRHTDTQTDTQTDRQTQQIFMRHSLLRKKSDPLCLLCAAELDTSLQLLGRCHASMDRQRHYFGFPLTKLSAWRPLVKLYTSNIQGC